MGDTFDRRKYINFVTLSRSRSMYFDELDKRNIELHAITGNHSTSFKNTNEINSLDLLLKEYKNFHLYISDPVELKLDSANILLVPWLCSENIESSLKTISETKCNILMGHFEVLGFEMIKGTVNTHGISKDTFKNFDMVYSGHFHHPSSKENISYLGAPYEMVWSDYNGKRGFHIFDTETLELTFVLNPYKIFNRLDYSDSDLTVDQINSFDVSLLTNTFVKIFVTEKTNPYLFDLFLDKIQTANPADLKVIDMETTHTLTEEIEFDENQDTVSFLKSYIANIDTKLDKVLIEDYVTNLYREAVNL